MGAGLTEPAEQIADHDHRDTAESPQCEQRLVSRDEILCPPRDGTVEERVDTEAEKDLTAVAALWSHLARQRVLPSQPVESREVAVAAMP